MRSKILITQDAKQAKEERKYTIGAFIIAVKLGFEPPPISQTRSRKREIRSHKSRIQKKCLAPVTQYIDTFSKYVHK